jgi:Na+/phosphate symporter
MKNIRGWIGVAMFFVGMIMLFIEQTKSASWAVIGFGFGMIASGFQNG